MNHVRVVLFLKDSLSTEWESWYVQVFGAEEDARETFWVAFSLVLVTIVVVSVYQWVRCGGIGLPSG